MRMNKRAKKSSLVGAIRRVKLQTRLLVAFLAVSLIPVVFIGAYAYRVYTASIHSKLGESAEQSAKLLNKTLQLELERYSFYINTLSTSDAVQDMLSAQPLPGDPSLGAYSRSIKQIIDSTALQAHYLRNIQIADKDGRILYDLGYDDVTTLQFENLLPYIDDASPKDSLRYVYSYRTSENLVLGRKIFKYSLGTEHIGYMLVYINTKLLHDKVFNDIDFGQGSNILLVAADGEVLSSSKGALQGSTLFGEPMYTQLQESAALGQTTFSTRVDGQGALAVFNHSPLYDSYFIATVPNSYIENETRHITTNLVLVAALLFAVSFAAMILIYRSIMQPIRNIIATCNVVADEDLDRPIGDDSPDEMGFLARTLDQLIVELKGMAYQWQNDQKRKRELELESLQYQINPHFLFNTLNTLKWVASINEVPILYEGIGSLSALLQSTLIKKDEVIPIAEELDNLSHYFSIQKIRYADCFDVEYDVDKSLLRHSIPRFILQPLAENAIIHGTGEGGRTIRIAITCHAVENGDVVLGVADNGHGFELPAAQGTPREAFSGIGLSNVDERLKLYYGAEYGLDIQSEPGRGTVCTIRLPAQESGKEEA